MSCSKRLQIKSAKDGIRESGRKSASLAFEELSNHAAVQLKGYVGWQGVFLEGRHFRCVVSRHHRARGRFSQVEEDDDVDAFAGENAPSKRSISTCRPVSSKTSLWADSSGSSRASIKPPGKHQSPTYGSNLRLTSTIPGVHRHQCRCNRFGIVPMYEFADFAHQSVAPAQLGNNQHCCANRATGQCLR